MKTIIYRFMRQFCLILALVLAVWCHLEVTAADTAGNADSTENPHMGSEDPESRMPPKFRGTVTEIIDTTRHIYVCVDIGEKDIWVAVPQFAGKVGDTVVVPPGVRVAEFHSRALDRVFEVMYFVGGLRQAEPQTAGNAMEGLPKGHPPVHQDGSDTMRHPPMDELSADPAVHVGDVEKAEGGQTVEEIITNRKSLSGETIRLRARVVKVTPNVMDRNWLHVRDGTGGKGTNDLIVTTDQTAETGDVVLIRGPVSVDRDFGFGLEYPVIVEDAEVSVEENAAGEGSTEN
jgi:hypothetical protein